MAPSVRASRTHRRIRGGVADLLLGYVLDGRKTPELRLAPVVEGRWADFPFASYACLAGLGDSGGIAMHCEARAGAEPFRDMLPRIDELNSPSSFQLNDGSSLLAEKTHASSWGGVTGPDGAYHGVVIALHHWEWRSHVVPKLWVGRLQGAAFLRGNLGINERVGKSFRTRTNNMRLDGHARWHVVDVPNEEFPIAVLVPPATGLTRGGVRSDFMAAEFAFGQAMQLDELIGLDDNGSPVAALGLHLGGFRRRGRRCPVRERFDDANWPPILFAAIAKRLATEGDQPLLVAMSAYLDGVSSHLDLGYLAVQIGLEAFSSAITQGAGQAPLVKDSAAWLKWVKSQSPAFRAHALRGQAAKLEGKVGNAQNAPSGDRVLAALRKYDLRITPSEKKELSRRNRVAHAFLMSDGPDRDVVEDVRRRNLMLTVLAALVARYVKFKGPLAGAEWASNRGELLVPTWWAHDERDSGDWFICKRERG